jgi:hypothetical protein
MERIGVLSAVPLRMASADQSDTVEYECERIVASEGMKEERIVCLF